MKKILITESQMNKLITESINSQELKDFFKKHGGVKRLYTNDEVGNAPDKRVFQDGLSDVTDDMIMYMEEFPDVNSALHQAWGMNHPKDRNGSRKPWDDNVHYTVYKANDGSAVVVGLDKSKFETGFTWGGTAGKKSADRVNNNGWNPKTRSTRYADDSDTYYTGKYSPSNDFGYHTNKDFKNGLPKPIDMRNYVRDKYPDMARRMHGKEKW